MPRKPNLLWIDDDTPKITFDVEGVEVTCVQTCADAERQFEKMMPDYVVVDLVLPQAGWRKHRFFEMPGIPLARQFETKYEKKPKIVVFAMALSEEAAAQVNKSHWRVYDKMTTPFPDVVMDLKNTTAERD